LLVRATNAFDCSGPGSCPRVPRLQPGRVRSPDRGLPTFAERPGRSQCGCLTRLASHRTAGDVVSAAWGV